PNGQLPAYEWAFGDVNPPVHAWAAMRVFENDRNQRGGEGDLDFLERVFHKLLLNFTWWVNRKDPQGLNIFEGDFLGLDNVGVFDRSPPLPSGGNKNWRALHCRGGCNEFWRSSYCSEACGGHQRANPICLDTHHSAFADATGAHRVHSQASRCWSANAATVG